MLPPVSREPFPETCLAGSVWVPLMPAPPSVFLKNRGAAGRRHGPRQRAPGTGAAEGSCWGRGWQWPEHCGPLPYKCVAVGSTACAVLPCADRLTIWQLFPSVALSLCCCTVPVWSLPHEGGQPTSSPRHPLSLHSGPHRGSGSSHWDDGDGLWLRIQDQEGHVPHRGAALQGVPHQANGHSPEHQPQLCTLHHPQSREAGTCQDRPMWASQAASRHDVGIELRACPLLV